MNFKNLLQTLEEARSDSEAFGRTGEAIAKERAKGASSSAKEKDKLRKRAERARQIPRERQPKDQLVKQIYVVKTRGGKLQLIFKDSFNQDIHTRVSDKELSVAEARQVASDPNFEQTRASVLLFGDVKEKTKEEPQKGKPKQPEEKEKAAPAKAQAKPTKAKKLSPQEMLVTMSQMTPEQLATMPVELRQEYFKSTRKPIANRDFDNLADSYEKVVSTFGVNTSTTIPFNQQVLNAFMFLAKIKSGAGEQELQTYSLMAPTALEFTKSAFLQAKKLLSQIGEDCIQNLLSNAEKQQTSVDSAGAVDMGCGDFRFKISAGGEISLSTKSFDQSNKSFKGYLANSLYKTIQQELQNPSDEKTQAVFQEITAEVEQFGQELVSKDVLRAAQSNPKLMEKLQKTEVVDSNGVSKGFVIDENGNLNPYASLENYQDLYGKYTKQVAGSIKSSKSGMVQSMSSDILKTVLRGDQLVDPMAAPTHLVTANGVFPMSDEYMAEISKTADFEMKPAKELITSSNIERYRPSAANTLKNFRTVVEQKEEKTDLKNIFVNKAEIDHIKIIVGNIVNKYDFDFNASLLPGFSPKDLNTVKYNYITIGKKTIKIPVMSAETPSVSQVIGESYSYINDVLVESLTNNFVLTNLKRSFLVNDAEAHVLTEGTTNLYESPEVTQINLLSIFENVVQRVIDDPSLLQDFHEMTFGSIAEEAKRNYEKEYKNYHGKAKQRKERAARTRARELMKKKGIVKKGDGKDIDHKKPLRSGGSNGINNLRVRNKSENRSDNGHKKGEKQSKDWK